MSATATSFGTATWGIPSGQTGFILESVKYNYKPTRKECRDISGNTLGVIYYDEMVNISIAGIVPTTSPFAGTVAASLTLGNSLTAYLKGGSTGGTCIIDEITTTFSNEDFRKIDLSATYFPNV